MDDARYRQIMISLGMENSHSLLQALKQVANEVEQSTRASLANEIAKLREQRTRLVVIAREYARENPPHDFRGVMQDPNEVHAILAAIESESASPDAGKDEPFGKFDENVVNKAFDQAMKEPLEISVSNLDEYDDRYNGKRTEGT